MLCKSTNLIFLNYFCGMQRLLYLLLPLILFLQNSYAQSKSSNSGNSDSAWTLESSIFYAKMHNIDLRKSVLNERLSQLQLKQMQLSQIPNSSISANYGKSFGRSVDPTSNQFINTNYDFSGLNGNMDVLLFGWFQKRNNISSQKFSLQAARADYEQLQDDISLNVATAYLRILLAQENIGIAESQQSFSNKQLQQTQAFVNAGRLPELESAQMEAQVASDSSMYFTAISNFNQAILDMKALMNLDMESNYNVVMPEINAISFTEFSTHSPAQIYEIAKNNFSNIKSAEFKIKAAQKAVTAQKGALYPQLGLGYQIGTNYSSTLKEITNFKLTGSEPTGDFVNISGTPYPVLQPTGSFNTKTTPYFSQFDNNLRQTVVLSLTVPLFNGWVTKYNIKQAKVNVENEQLEQERSFVKLKQDVYSAYFDANAAIKKYYASKKAADAAQRALDFAEKRYDLGLMNTVELLTTQNTNFKAQSDAVSAKYDLYFKLKVIDYYLGNQIKL